MQRKIFTCVILLFLIFGNSSCGKKDKKQTVATKTVAQPAATVVATDTISHNYKITDDTNTTKSKKERSNDVKLAATKETVKKPVVVSKKYKIYTNLQNLLSSIGLGETKTKQQLIDSKIVPDDALQIVKSVTKVSENELVVTWKSMWLIEKVSDVKLKDDKVKVEFKNGLVYTFGNAIGIKYEGEVYHNLIIKGDRAYIPSVKEYNWKIGK